MRRAVRVACTVLANAILILAILVFAKGFFPYKAVLPGLATWPENRQGPREPAPFDKVIFMVVDALRSDFVYGNASEFHFTQRLIRSGAAHPYTGHARPPTITMPRVKSITTGSVPSFLDLVLSFDESDTSSTLATQDSWLAQLKAKQTGKLVMYGDDTWLRLFPDFFDRSDGTTSFFVSDFTEVDNNVTRHVPEMLKQEDWSGVVLHYLGLDHIGHKTGPRGPNMPAKQKEMDGIVELIYNAMTSESHLGSALLVLLGDHGMNDAGNHGANSAGEVSTAMVFISPKFQEVSASVRATRLESPLPLTEDFTFYQRVDQADLAATLAALMGFPTPRNNLGVMVSELVRLFMPPEDHLILLKENAAQIASIAQATYAEVFMTTGASKYCDLKSADSLTPEERMVCLWTASQDPHADETDHLAFLESAQRLLSKAASQYDVSKLYVGVLLAGSATILAVSVSASGLSAYPATGTAFISTCVLYAITLFASSYVEEEHQFWYWTTSAWLLILSISNQRTNKAESGFGFVNSAAFLVFGAARRWNQTGQKFAGEDDLMTAVMRPNTWLLWLLILACYAAHAIQFLRCLVRLQAGHTIPLAIFVPALALSFKLAFTAADAPELLEGFGFLKPASVVLPQISLVGKARLVFAGLLTLIAVATYYLNFYRNRTTRLAFLRLIHSVVSLFLVTQTRTSNIPLFLAFILQLYALESSRPMNSLELVFTILLMQYASFFTFGGTNAISSVDLSNAYNGVAGFNVVVVGILTFVSNWAGSIWWASSMVCVLQHRVEPRPSKQAFNHFGLFTLFTSTSVLATLLACTVLREHLFIWTVFSPKYLYMAAWTVGLHVVVDGLVCGVITMMGG